MYKHLNFRETYRGNNAERTNTGVATAGIATDLPWLS